jgi:hypothetical protein
LDVTALTAAIGDIRKQEMDRDQQIVQLLQQFARVKDDSSIQGPTDGVVSISNLLSIRESTGDKTLVTATNKSFDAMLPWPGDCKPS